MHLCILVDQLADDGLCLEVTYAATDALVSEYGMESGVRKSHETQLFLDYVPCNGQNCRKKSNKKFTV